MTHPAVAELDDVADFVGRSPVRFELADAVRDVDGPSYRVAVAVDTPVGNAEEVRVRRGQTNRDRVPGRTAGAAVPAHLAAVSHEHVHAGADVVPHLRRTSECAGVLVAGVVDEDQGPVGPVMVSVRLRCHVTGFVVLAVGRMGLGGREDGAARPEGLDADGLSGRVGRLDRSRVDVDDIARLLGRGQRRLCLDGRGGSHGGCRWGLRCGFL